MRHKRWKKKPAAKSLKKRRIKMCEECGINPADIPSKICVGCEAYKEHQK